MINKKKFTTFRYVVGNDFIYEDKVQVKVFFLYGYKMIIKIIDITKKKDAPESYYRNEAKKIIDQMIKDDSLIKECDKKIKRKKALEILIPISAMVVAGIGVGTYFAVRPSISNTGYEIIIPEISGVSIDVGDIQPGKDLEATISVNNDDRKDNPQGLPHTLEVKVGDKVLSPDEYTYTLNPGRESATIHIDASKINGAISFSFAVTDLAWYENHYYIDALTKEDITKDDGVVKTLTVNGQPHKVRLIGVDEDYGTIGDESTKIHTTWEFANFISDEDGFSLATQWNDTNDTDETSGTANHNYLDSSLRMALVGEKQELGHILWAQRGAEVWSTNYKNKCVLDMLPSELVSVLKTPSKYINIYNTATTQYEEKTVNDKLFLLSPKEMGNTEDIEWEEEHTTTYSYYKGAQDGDRVKKQVNNEEVYGIEPEIYDPDSGQVYDDIVLNAAGYNASVEAWGGGLSWFRSPCVITETFGNQYAWLLGAGGGIIPFEPYHFVYNRALAIAPAFCI